MRISSGSSGRFEREHNISPGSHGTYPQSPPLSPPKPPAPSMNFSDHRRELAVLQNPHIVMRQTPPSASPSPINGNATPSFLNSNIFDSHHDPFQQLSPHRPGTAPTTGGPQDSYFPDETRRPSVASVVTNASSTGSKSSMGKSFYRKLFGEGDTSGESPGSSESSLPPNATPRSQQYGFNRPTTPTGSRTGSRPRTPLPSAEVVPFLYQNPDVSLFGTGFNRVLMMLTLC